MNRITHLLKVKTISAVTNSVYFSARSTGLSQDFGHDIFGQGQTFKAKATIPRPRPQSQGQGHNPKAKATIPRPRPAYCKAKD